MTRNRIPLSPRRLLGAASVLALSVVLPASAGEEARAFNIPSQPLSEAVMEFARQSNLNVVAPAHLTRGKTSRAISGEMDPRDALRLLMSDAPIDVRSGNDGAIILVQAVTDVPKPQTTPAAPPATLPATPRDPAETADSQPARSAPLQRTDNREDEERTLGRVTVTGTILRGFAPESSPLQIYTRDDILGSGVTTTEQFMRTLPQNFGGGSTEFAASNGLPGDNNSTFNSTFGTGANLRGLGSRGTLTLLNGNRLAPTSQIGDFVDLSMIPISAVERIDVLTDGASSIYGGDAVAGVVNFVLRDDFEGAETTIRYGNVTRGDMQEVRFSQALGTSWKSGNVLASYEFFDRGSLVLSDRPDLAVPTLTNGQPIPNPELFDLLPNQKRNSALLTLNQEISPALKVSATGLYSKRSSDSTTALAASSATTSNYKADSEFYSASLGADYEISSSWGLSLGATYSEVQNKERAQTLLPTLGPVSQRNTSSDLWAADALLSGDLFDLPGGRILAAVGAHYREENFNFAGAAASTLSRDGSRNVSAVFGELFIPLVGANNARPGIERLEINLSGRVDDFSDFGTTANPKVGALWSPISDLNLRGSYSESFAPPPLGRTGDLSRTGAVAPYAFILNLLGLTAPDPALASMDYLVATGTAVDLGPETSQTFTAGFDYELSQGAQNWKVNFSYYDIEFEGRLGTTPMPQNRNFNSAPNIFADDPEALPPGTVIFFPTADEIAAIVASALRPIIFQQGATSLDNIGIINNAQIVRNLASTKTSGVDLHLGYDVETEAGLLTAGFNANYITKFTQQATVSTPAVDILDTLYNPVALQLRGNIGLSRGGFRSKLFVNHIDSYRADSTPAAAPIKSWTTMDISLSYEVEARQWWLNNSAVSLSVSNLFDRNPPSAPTIGTFRITGYDPANASPVGRFIAVELRKTF